MECKSETASRSVLRRNMATRAIGQERFAAVFLRGRDGRVSRRFECASKDIVSSAEKYVNPEDELALEMTTCSLAAAEHLESVKTAHARLINLV